MNTNLSKDLFSGPGEIHQLICTQDWSQTLLGPRSLWPQSLRTALSLILNSPNPLFIWWGKEYANLYNDAYRPILGTHKHPQFLGQSAADCWAEVWDVVGELAASVLHQGQSTSSENVMLVIQRSGYAEETYFTFSYSPIVDESGGVGGIFGAVTETTQEMIRERRLQTLRKIATHTTKTESSKRACECLTEAIASDLMDIPFALLYCLNEKKQAILAGTTGIKASTSQPLSQIDLTQSSDPWQLTTVNRTRKGILLENLSSSFENLPTGVWDEPPDSAMVMPLVELGQSQLAGFLILGISPRRAFDDSYRGFFELIAHHVATVMANVQADKIQTQQIQARIENCSSLAFPQTQEGLIYCTEIVERKQAEETLRQSEERFRAAQELSLDAFTILQSVRNSSGEIIDFEWTYVNPKAAQLLQQTVEGLMGQRLLEVLPGNKTNSDLFERYVRVVETGEPHDIELCYQSEGIVGWFRNMAVKIGDGIAISFSEISDRKLAEKALRQSEERLRVALKSAPITLFNQDQSLRYTWVYNPVLNQSVETILGNSDFDLLPKEAATRLTHLKRQVLDTGIGTREEVLLVVKGQKYYFDLTIEPLRNSEDELIGVTCAAVDISDYKQVKFALRQSDTILNTFLSSSPIGLAVFDRNLRYLYANETLAAMNGLPLKEHIGRRLGEVVPHIRAEFAPLLEQVIETRQPLLNREFRGQIYPGDEIHHYLANHFPVCLSDGEVLGVGVTVMDITELKRAEAALRESEATASARAEELKTFMETVPAAVWIAHDPQCHRMTANLAAHELVQLPSEGIVTATPADGRYPFAFKIQHQGRDIPLEDLPMQKAGRTGENIEAEFEFVFENGEVRFIYGRAVPLRGEVGEIRGVIGAFLDVSDRKRAEQEREQLLIRERAAREEAEGANRIKDEFLAILSHELRSPLNPILGWTKLLQTRKFDSQATAHALETIERNAKLQTQLIEDLLDISRILRGKMVLHQEPVNLITTIESALETVKLAAEAKGIQVQFEVIEQQGIGTVAPLEVWSHFLPKSSFTKHNIYVLGDKTRLQQVIWNLLSNAIKFTPSGGFVNIRLESKQGQAYLQVKDTGIGINPQFLPYVFDYFRQQDGTTTRKFGGLGLGLAIVRHLTELHGGTVSAESLGEGCGAVFVVKLPLMEYEIEAPQAQKPKIEGIDLTGLRVLAVDDEPDIRDLIEFILEKAGAEVRAIGSAREALNLIKEFSPDVLVSDIGMPDMDGYMLITEVRKTSAIPAIALTAYAGETNNSLALAAGFQIHLAKPVEPDELVVCIAALTKCR
ncbi:putative Histidine kinase [Planktothrix serta PCC 8927]|uniref:histidine kinase n=1 Tax=Planktothrix serta PCC 8927 TaxID=671068 RepID=A0A7Z9BXS6_9CYAN|nr:PAS domain-containing protein [Planktothrix serta]VXD23132.1 putative Histidine kinase [Planktothrix serta PCC 8927]